MSRQRGWCDEQTGEDGVTSRQCDEQTGEDGVTSRLARMV